MKLVRWFALCIFLFVLLFATGCEDARTPVDRAVGWFPTSQQATARCIVHYESTENPNAVSPGRGNWGLFQINTVHRRAFESLTHQPFYNQVLDPTLNGQYAYVLWKQVGWSAWSTHRRCGV